MAEKKAAPIVLLTDFGTKDTFAGVLKGVIYNIHPNAVVIDLTHDVELHNIVQAAFLLSVNYAYFPKGSVFCAVVDPGVGSDRKAVCIQSRHYTFVGPDNGLLWPAASQDGIIKTIHLNNANFFLSTVSKTFHGRDIFAPVAAHISKGLNRLDEFGNGLNECQKIEIPRISEKDDGIEITVLYTDRFGNVGLNISRDQFTRLVQENGFCLNFNNHQIARIFENYSQAQAGQLFLIGASSGNLEISLKNSSAADVLGVKTMDTGILTLVSQE